MLAITSMLLLVVKLGWAAQCNKLSGPPGGVDCIQKHSYNDEYQWMTCLTDAYIQQKGNQKDHCEDRAATYCWYPCMLEVHGKGNGSVASDCSCTSGNPSTLTPTTLLPSKCYIPPGDSCYWYRNCLERKYPCEFTSNGYAIKYAEHFCKLDDKNFAKFSLIARNWVIGVHKCLQVSLMPLLRPWIHSTCGEIQERAFASQTPCYLNPGNGVLSACDLDCSNYLQIFWSIKGSFVKVDTVLESLKGMWNIGEKCTWYSNIRKCYRSIELEDSPVKVIKLKIEKFLLRSRRSTNNLPESNAQSRFADGVGSAIASALKWNSDVMDWLAYTGRVQDPENLEIVVLLADKKALGIAFTSAPSVNFKQTIEEFTSAVKQGVLPLKVDGHNVWVKSLASCSNKACTSTQTLAVSDKPPNWNGTADISGGKVIICGTITMLVMMMTNAAMIMERVLY